MDRGFLEKPFLRFLLKNFAAKPVEYLYTSSAKKKKETILSIPLINTLEQRSLQELIQKQKITFAGKTKAPKFLPVYLSRPIEKRYNDKRDQPGEASRTPVAPSNTLEIPIAKNMGYARYKLVSIVIGRDSIKHAYSYVLEKGAWVEYNDSRVIIHKDPETKKRSKNSKLTPFEDACKHSQILVYEFTGYT